MRSFLKNAFSTLVVTVLSTSALQANAYDGCDTCCAPRVEPCYGYAYNPGVFIADCCGWYANIAYLYWKPSQEGISAGTLNNLSQNTNGSSTRSTDFLGTANAQQVYPKFDWDSGFRLGIGYHLPCDSWAVGLEYTHYRTDTHTTYASAFTNSSTSGIQGSLFSPAYTGTLGGGTSAGLGLLSETQVAVELDWRIQFNQLDLDFNREFYVARWMTLMPHVGLRALFINQSYDIQKNASGTDPFAPITTVTSIGQFRESIKMNNDFKGVGLEGGLDMSFDLGCNLAFYGEVGGGATFGRARVTQRDNATTQFGITAITATDQVNYRVTDNYDTILCNADLAFGIRWRQRVNCDQSLFSVDFGYEEHIFFGYNRFRNLLGPAFQGFLSNSPTGNLSFYGIVLAAAIDF